MKHFVFKDFTAGHWYPTGVVRSIAYIRHHKEPHIESVFGESIHLILQRKVAPFVSWIFHTGIDIYRRTADMDMGMICIFMDHIVALVLTMKAVKKLFGNLFKDQTAGEM